jgi:hypothetical protein
MKAGHGDRRPAMTSRVIQDRLHLPLLPERVMDPSILDLQPHLCLAYCGAGGVASRIAPIRRQARPGPRLRMPRSEAAPAERWVSSTESQNCSAGERRASGGQMGLCPCDDRASASDDRSIVGHQDGNILLASQLDDLPSLAAPAEGNVLESAYDLYLISHASIVESFRGNTAGMLDHRRVGAVRPCGAGVEDHCLDAKRSPWSLPRYSCVRQVVHAAIRASALSGNRGGPEPVTPDSISLIAGLVWRGRATAFT